MAKLVRDKIPALIMAEGTPVRVSHAKIDDMPELLVKKLREETVELQDAIEIGEDDAILNELADLQELLFALAHAHQMTANDLSVATEDKRKLKGGFGERYVLHGTVKARAATNGEPAAAAMVVGSTGEGAEG